MPQRKVEPHVFVILGATGNLARRKLFPAIYHLSAKALLRGKSIVVGVARGEYDHHSFRVLGKEMLQSAGLKVENNIYSPWCEKCLFYQPIRKGTAEDYNNLATEIEALEHEYKLPSNRVFYLALPPVALPESVKRLGDSGLNKSAGWTRLVVEKPFGQDLDSARRLNSLIHRYFDESQIYRIDHFLGKETVQNLLVFRFANAFFEHLWSREHIESVEVTVAEDVGIEGRSAHYEQTGALRDMVQNHLTQLLTLVAMEAPVAFNANDIRNEKAKVLRQIPEAKLENVVFGQYSRGEINGEKVVGYRYEPGVAPESKSETFVALKLEIANWRWAGVPFYLRTGKRMAQRLTQIMIKFHHAPVSIFQPLKSTHLLEPNLLTITLQPDEGFDLRFQVKSIGQPISLTNQHLRFKYSEAFGPLPDAYENLLLDVITGDQTLFVRYDEVEGAWRLYDELLKEDIQVDPYPAGTWGPPKADKLLSGEKPHSEA